MNEAEVNRAFPQQALTILIIVDGRTPELAELGAARLAARLATDKQHFSAVKRPDGGPWLAQHGVLFGSVAEVRSTTQSLIGAQPLLGPLAADPSLRGIAGAFGTILTGVENGSAKLADIDRPMVALDGALCTFLLEQVDELEQSDNTAPEQNQASADRHDNRGQEGFPMERRGGGGGGVRRVRTSLR